MEKILITGSSGFVGGNLTSYLAEEYEILMPDRAELQNLTLDCDAIVHLAGKAHDIKRVSDPQEYLKVNFELTKDLYDRFLQSRASIFIFVSSVKAAADQVDTVLCEDHVPDPQTPYGKSKLLAENYIREQKLPSGKMFYILRPCMIHGPGNKGNLNLLFNIIKKGIPYPLAAFENQRSFLSVGNLCFVIRELLKQKNITSGIFNVADDIPLSTNELISLIGKGSHRDVKLWRVSPGIIKAICKIGDQLQLPLTTERLLKLTESYVVSNRKLKKALKKDLPIDSKEGILHTIASFGNNRSE